MTPAATITILRQFNEWRRGDEDLPQPNPKQITEAINAAVEMIERLEAAEKERDALRFEIQVREAARKRIERERDNANVAVAGMVLEAERLQAKVEAMEQQEPVAKVRANQAGGNAGLAWSVAPLNDFESLPPLRDGDNLYALPGAASEAKP